MHCLNVSDVIFWLHAFTRFTVLADIFFSWPYDAINGFLFLRIFIEVWFYSPWNWFFIVQRALKTLAQSRRRIVVFSGSGMLSRFGMRTVPVSPAACALCVWRVPQSVIGTRRLFAFRAVTQKADERPSISFKAHHTADDFFKVIWRVLFEKWLFSVNQWINVFLLCVKVR